MHSWFLIALSAPFLWAITNHLDKYLVAKIGTSIGIRGIITFSALFASVILVLIAIFTHSIGAVAGMSRAVLIVSGIVGTISILFYLKALQISEATIVVAFMQLMPIFSYFLGLIFFHEVFSGKQILAALITIVGAAILSIDFEKKGKNRFRKKVVVFMIAGSFFFSLNQALFKLVTLTPDTFWVSTFWQYLGIFFTGSIFLLIRSFRRDFFAIFRTDSVRLIKLNVLIELLTVLGNMAATYAVVLAPLALVMLLFSYQPVFVFILGIVITLFSSERNCGENVEKSPFFRRLLPLHWCLSAHICFIYRSDIIKTVIPEFPNFKPIELSDKEEVEKFTKKFPPYSDFNFVSMWSWDIKGEMRISQLNGNLVVQFSDYLTGEPFYSFLGDNKVVETARELISFSEKKYDKNLLRLVSEEARTGLEKSGFNLNSDQDAFDYVYSVSHLSNMHNWTKHSSGKSIRSFIKASPSYVVKHDSIKDAPKEEYVEMFKKWAVNSRLEDYLNLNEYKALDRIFAVKHDNIRLVSVYVNDAMVGFTVYEILPHNYAISHFAKADIKYHRAISDILNWEEAKILDIFGVKYFNWEQDLGIPGLRKSKEKYKPSFLLKKHTVGNKK